MKYKIRHKAIWLVLAATLFPGCSGDDSPNQANNNNGKDSEIRLNAEVWRVMEGTRATTYDGSTITSEPFKCYAYNDGGTSPYLDGLTVSYSAGQWSFDAGRQVWPDNALDFFAYMPASYDDYITGLTYTTARRPQFTCDMTQTVNKEFIWALTTGQDREHQGASGVTMTFKHPFARIYFQLSNESESSVTINSITISGDFYTTGTCTFDGTTSTWSNQGGAGSLGTFAIGTPYIVIPNDYGSSKTITVNATWDEWGTFTTSVTSSALSINWEAGYSYTYTLTLSKYALNVDVNKYTEQW